MGKNADLAVAYFKEGYNCSQAVARAFAGEAGIDEDMITRLASSFGGGVGRMREVCGAFSGACMIAGLKYGYLSPKAGEEKKAHYKLIQEMGAQFKEKNGGSIVCRELLGLSPKPLDPTPEKRDETYYKKRPCVEIVRSAAEILEGLLEQEKLSQKA